MYQNSQVSKIIRWFGQCGKDGMRTTLNRVVDERDKLKEERDKLKEERDKLEEEHKKLRNS
jgi:hypothetical protein